MIKHVWSVLCRELITDHETNSVSYINCVERIQAGELPLTLPPCWLGTLWRRHSSEDQLLQVRILLLDPEQHRKSVFQSQEVMVETPNMRFNIRIIGLTLESEGTHSFVIQQRVRNRWKRATEIPLDVALADASAGSH